MESIESHHGPGQVQGFQELSEMAGLIVLDVHLKMVQEPPAVLRDTQQVHPGAVAAAGPAGGLAVHRHGP